MTNELTKTYLPGYDVIGDIHGNAEKLEGLLVQMGYVEDSVNFRVAYRHPVRQAIFVGDLIDRGPSQERCLEVVKAMTDAGSAQCVLGNHELNALAYAALDPETGEFCRPHKSSNRKQHAEFLDQMGRATREYYLDWFRTLPLWLDLGELRVIHACWHEPSRLFVERELGGNTFATLADQIRATTKRDKNELFVAVELLLKGPETNLRDYGLPYFQDKDGKARHDARLRWWVENTDLVADLVELPAGARTVDGTLYPEIDPNLHVNHADIIRVTGDTPVIYGHYWRRWATGDAIRADWRPPYGLDWTKKTACVDFASVKGGPLVAYQWNLGDVEINAGQYAAYR
jgi:hypothetical protein